MVAAVETMMYAKEQGVPWHGLGTEVEETPFSAEAIKAAGLDWDVAKAPMFARIGEEYRPVENRVAIYRLSDGAILGDATEDYQPLNNRQAFEITDQVMADLGIEARYTTAGALWGGKQVFVSAKLPEDIEIHGSGKRTNDRLEQYLLLRTGHDAGTSLDIFPTAISVVCYNTLNLALGSRGTVNYTTYHFGSWDDKRSAIRRYFQEMMGRFGTYKTLAQQLADLNATAWHEERVTNALFPRIETASYGGARLVFGPKPDEHIQLVPEAQLRQWEDKRNKRIEIFKELRKEEDSSLWGLFNAATGYADHARPGAWKRPEVRFRHIMWQNAATLKARALETMYDIVGTSV